MPASSDATTHSLAAHPQRILCVEADAARRCEMFSVFARPGLTVECVRDGQEAIEHFEKYGPPDLLVTAHMLPRIDGLALVGRLRQAGFAGRVVVIGEALPSAAVAGYRDLQVASILPLPLAPGVLWANAELPAA